ncbi:MAG: lipid-A-disaccharide synthase N-terminal domain-containing protein [Planctomycetota bacterium]
MLATLSWEWAVAELGKPLVIFGFAGQFIFFLRFAVQWFESERRGRSHIPLAFWYLSLVGGGITFIYACMKPDLVFMVAQALGLLIYIRNLMLIYRRRRKRPRVPVRGASRAEVGDGVAPACSTGLQDGLDGASSR